MENSYCVNLEETIRNLSLSSKDEDAFYAFWFLMVRRTEKSLGKTACVFLDKESTKFGMDFNPEFWNSLTREEQVYVLKHEALHIMLGHLFRTKPDQYLDNMATDLVINGLLGKTDMPKFGLHPDQFGFEVGLSSDQYYDLLEKDKQEFTKQIIEGLKNGTLKITDPGYASDHMWGDIKIDLEKEGLSEIVKMTVEGDIIKANESFKNSGRGTVPGYLEELIKALYKVNPPQVNWKQELRKFIGSKKSESFRKTVRKESRKFEFNPGRRKTVTGSVAFVVDTSGSMSSNLLAKAFTEIHNIWKKKYNIEVIECDTQVNKTWVYKGNWNMKCTGRGGTVLSPAIEYVNTTKHNVCVVLTDGFFESNIKKCKLNTLFLTTGKVPEGTIGKVIKIKE